MDIPACICNILFGCIKWKQYLDFQKPSKVINGQKLDMCPVAIPLETILLLHEEIFKAKGMEEADCRLKLIRGGLELILEVVLAIPGVELTGALIGCGTCSGRDTDKAAKVGLTMQEVEGTNIKAPVPCKLLIHATVAQTMDADDHVVHLCDVKGVYGDEDVNAVFGWKGYAEFAAAQQK